MSETVTQLPNPDREMVLLWLRSLNRQYIHTEGWVEVNQRFHPITQSVRSFLRAEYPDPAQQEAMFDGLTLGLLAMLHFTDIRQIEELYGGILPPGAVNEQISGDTTAT